MTFRAKRVRIQIPCGGSGSIVNPDDTAIFAGCDAGCSDSPQSAVCPPIPPPPAPQPPCGVPSNLFGINPWDEVVLPAEPALFSPEDLPLLREQLELRMKMLALADDATALARNRVRSKLADIAQAEEELKNDGNV